MSENFTYLINKIKKAEFHEIPFKHLELNEFLNEKDFNEITSSEEINLSEQATDENLFEELFKYGYKIIPFPGAITDHKQYIENHKRNIPIESHSACESSGVVLRLMKPKTKILIDLKNFIESKEFNLTLAEKFNLDLKQCSIDTGIQKYLDGYEISPHPDLRKKALTFMININTSEQSFKENYHTHYLEFKINKNYVKEYWKGNPYAERCWIPWDWCVTKKQQKNNNSIIIFSPSFDSLHAIKANYLHLKNQRTQIYGNLWYKNEIGYDFIESNQNLDWNQLNFQPQPHKYSLAKRILNKIKNFNKGNLENNLIDRSRKDNY
ncbi:hypothetical protein N8092_00810 [Pelagibacteraceae bacterium]|nr:hypothetical protein [Pelagibacteraceae bacterium]